MKTEARSKVGTDWYERQVFTSITLIHACGYDMQVEIELPFHNGSPITHFVIQRYGSIIC
jgi:hypothetical protein